MTLLFALWLIAADGQTSELSKESARASGAAVALTNREPVTLQAALHAAASHNPTMKNIRESIVLAEVWILKAWAILLPSVSANGSIIRNNQEIAFALPDMTGGGGPPQDVVFQELWGKSFGFTATMTVFNARSIPLLKNAYDNIEMTENQAKHQRNDLLLSTAAAFYQLYSAQELARVAEETLHNANEFLRMSQAQIQVGQGTQIDLLRAQIQVRSADKDLANAKDGIKLARAALSALTDMEGEYAAAEPPRPLPITGNVNSLTSRALTDRYDLKSAHLGEEIANRSEIETWTKWLPAFAVTYDWSWNSAAGFADQKDSWRLIFGARWDLFDGGMRIAEMSERTSLTRVAENNAAELSIRVSQEVEQRFIEVEKSHRNVTLAEEQVGLAEETARLVNKQYEVGMATSLDVLSTNSQLSAARVGRVLEGLQHDLAILWLNRAVGVLLIGSDS